jgi:hypothetical protein
MPDCQACQLVGRQDRDTMEDTRLLAQTQFRRRLVLLNAIDAHVLIPPKEDDEEHEELEASGGPMATQEMLDQEERKDALQLDTRASKSHIINENKAK